MSGHLDERWFRVLWSKMAAGVLAALGGLSLGREGPSIQLGGMCGKGFGKIFRRVSIEQRYLITCGAAARAFGCVQRAFGRCHVRAGGGAPQLFDVGHRFGHDRFCHG